MADTLPTSMRVIEITHASLVQSERPVPACGEWDVLVRVVYAALNRADIYQTQGSYPPPDDIDPTLRDVPGLEISGHIVAMGSEAAAQMVVPLAVGDAVCALLAGGGYAEYVAVHAACCLPVPHNITLQEAAGLPEAYATAWLALCDIAHLREDENILIHGGASGVGSAAIQLAVQHCGANAFTTVGSEEKAALVRSLGAHPILYKTQHFVTEIAKHAAGGKVDMVLDMVGGEYMQANIKSLRRGGRYVSIAFMRGAHAELAMGGLLLKNLSWHGMTLRSHSSSEKAMIMRRLYENVWPKLSNKSIKPLIDNIYPMEHAEKAHARMEECLHSGKILLHINP